MVLLPLVIRFALGFATEAMQPWLTVGSYFSMTARLCLAFGLLFELPMVVFALSWARVVHPKTMLKGWRWALLAILVASAVLTPPDVISQILLAGPVMLLYVGSVLISMVVRRREDRKRDEDDDDPVDPVDPDDPDDDPGDDDGGGPPPDPTPTGPPPETSTETSTGPPPGVSEVPELPLWESGPDAPASGRGDQPGSREGSSADPPEIRPASGTRARGDHDPENEPKTDD